MLEKTDESLENKRSGGIQFHDEPTNACGSEYNTW
jgi:hypothetical protein